jgi:hypothetical protein
LEADWEIEIGGDAPVIDACWPGFVDLRAAIQRALQLQEVQEFPALGAALTVLNASHSPFFTVKCDVWPVDAIDPLEFDAPADSAAAAIACYIDILPRDSHCWSDAQLAIDWCRKACSALQKSLLRSSRIDFVVRGAILAEGRPALGITSYIAACGPTEAAAKTQLGLALKVLADCVQSLEPGSLGPLKLQ